MSAKTYLVVASALDLNLPYGCTPSWWMLLKGMWTEGARIIAAPFAGAPVATPWWESLPNPAQGQGEIFRSMRHFLPAGLRQADHSLARWASRRSVLPKWEKLLTSTLEKEPGIRAVLWLNVPPALLEDLPLRLRERFGVAQAYYDGDAPTSLLPIFPDLQQAVRQYGEEPPRQGGFSSGLRQFKGPELGQFDLVVTNALGCREHYRQLGARQVMDLPWGADPELLSPPIDYEPDLDLLFMGHGEEYRQGWMRHLVWSAASDPSLKVAVAGSGLMPPRESHPVRLAEKLEWASMSRMAMRSRVQAVVTRASHAAIDGAATARLFELACLGTCMLCNPCKGLERWFTPGEEIAVADAAALAPAQLRALLREPLLRREMGRKARRRVLDEHTTAHRAKRLIRALDTL
jgi:hypothetical protein